MTPPTAEESPSASASDTEQAIADAIALGDFRRARSQLYARLATANDDPEARLRITARRALFTPDPRAIVLVLFATALLIALIVLYVL